MIADLETVQFLLSPEGEDLLSRAEALHGSFLTKLTTLRKEYPEGIAAAGLELLELRRRAAKKFSHAGEMFFTRDALEQASSEVVSRYRAGRYEEGSHVLDLACGIGGDTIGLAAGCFVTAVDRDPIRIAMAERNAAVYELSARVKLICADVADVPLEADAAFLDPSRRAEGRRSRSLAGLSPPVDFLFDLLEAVPDCAIKLSPLTPDDELISLGGEIEFLSESGECKEALVWFGRFRTTVRRATVLPQGATIAYEPVEPVPVRPAGRYLYEPDAAVIRAHLVQQLAWRIGAARMDERIAYLSSDELVPTPLADAYEVLESMPFNIKAINRRLRELGAGGLVVKKRGVPYEPREIARRLRTPGERELILVLTRISRKPWALICSRPQARR